MCKDLAQKKSKIVLIILPNINDLTLADIAKRNFKPYLCEAKNRNKFFFIEVRYANEEP